MSAVQAGSQASAPSGTYNDSDEPGSGWVLFSGVLLLLLGTLNFVEGVAAVGNAHFFVANTHYIAGSLNFWGWIAMIVGVVQVCVGLGVFVRNQLSRWAGVAILSINVIAQLMMMPAYPFWSLSVFTLDILAIYGLIAYGQHITD